MKTIKDVLLSDVPFETAVRHLTRMSELNTYSETKAAFDAYLTRSFVLTSAGLAKNEISLYDQINRKYTISCDIKSETFELNHFGKTIIVSADEIVERRTPIASVTLSVPDDFDASNNEIETLSETVSDTSETGLIARPGAWDNWYTFEPHDLSKNEYEFFEIESLFEVFMPLDEIAGTKGLTETIEVEWDAQYDALAVTFRGNTDKVHTEFYLRPGGKCSVTDNLLTYIEEVNQQKLFDDNGIDQDDYGFLSEEGIKILVDKRSI